MSLPRRHLLPTLFAVLAGLHLYDLSLHVEDLTPYTVPWQAPHTSSGGLAFVSYTEFWTLYWGTATVLSIVGLYYTLYYE